MTDVSWLLDELTELAEVEHALLIDDLVACCALGHDLEPAEGGATTDAGRDAAAAYAGLAVNQMFRFRTTNQVLVAAGRSPTTGRAERIVSAAGVATALCPSGAEDAAAMLARHASAARAVDERYAALRPVVAAATRLEDAVLEQIRVLLGEDGSPHTEDLARVTDVVPAPVPPGLAVVTRRVAADSFEQRLLDAADRMYGCVLAALQAHFEPSDPSVFTSYRQIAVSCMGALDDLDRALVQRGLLPAFTLV